MGKRSFYSIAFVLFFMPMGLYAGYDYNSNCNKALEALLNLRVGHAKKILQEEINQNPDNYYAYYLDHYCDVFPLIISTDNEAYGEFKTTYKERREIMDGKDEESPYYLILAAEMQMELGIINIIYGDRLVGLKNAYGGYKKTKKNIKLHPEHQANGKLDGIFDISAANLPPFIKWAAAAFGVRGDEEAGEEKLHSYYESYSNSDFRKLEAALINLFGYKLTKETGKAFDFLGELDPKMKASSKLLHYWYANIAYSVGKNELALEYMNNLHMDEADIEFAPHDYLTGKILFRKLDPNASIYLESYISNEAEMDYVKEVNYKLALYHLFNDELDNFEAHRLRALEDGGDITQRDREALYDANLDYIPDHDIAKARCLIDGSYFDQAAEYLNNFHEKNTQFLPYTLEFYLLSGRMALGRNQKHLAVEFFNKAIQNGNNEPYYFAAEAAMYLGRIFELSHPKLASSYYNQVLDLYEDEYYEYIEVFAEKGLKRIEN